MKDMPKVELHLHLEGAAPPDLIRALAAAKGMDLTGVFAPDGGYAFTDFLHFLQVYEAATATLKSPEDYHRLTRAVLQERAADGVIYLEAFLSPDFCGGGDLAAWREYLAAIGEAAAIEKRETGIEMRGIITPVRHFGPDRARRTAACAQETAGDFITGFGMGGDENAGKPANFAYAFDMAREAGLRLTTHAGEFAGPESVRASLRDLRVERIGHGVRAIEDPALVAELADEGITLEVCPGSNIALGLYSDWAAHPINALREAGVRVTVSTDDPPFFRTSLTREYEALAEAFRWDQDVLRSLNITAANAAFCDQATREALLKKLEPSP